MQITSRFIDIFLNARPPTRQANHNLNESYEETGSVADLKRSEDKYL
jgi:hypothetical protein